MDRVIPNILFSTTRGWNPGDDFILLGVLNLFNTLVPEFNTVIYDRNPELHQHASQRAFAGKAITVKSKESSPTFDLYETVLKQVPFISNSWQSENQLPLDFINLVVFAGTPEWLGSMVSASTAALTKHNLPCIYLGVGSFEGIKSLCLENLNPADQAALKNAEIITTRDANVKKLLTRSPANNCELAVSMCEPISWIR